MRYAMITSVLLGALSCSVAASSERWTINFFKTDLCKDADNVDSEGDSVGRSCSNMDSSVDLKGASFEATGTWVAAAYTEENCGGTSYILQNYENGCESPRLSFGDQSSFKSYSVSKVD
ncbi:hypothetical protein N7486_006487 [Penicillium sp. IBT 16267x]|nr:hypothetical protein N7486_006487 [Penicillium sp. IBT 16267x]